MAYQTDVQATRSALQSVDTTLSANINATQDFIPVASTTNFSTSVVAEIESTNEVVSFDTITKNFQPYSQDLSQSNYTKRGNCTVTANFGIAPDGTNTSNLISNIQGNNTPGGTYSDIFDVITTDYSTSGQPLEASFFIKRVSGSSTELFFSNPHNGANGNWKINFNSLSTTEFTRIDKNHPAVTVVNTYVSSGSGQAGTHFRLDSSSSANLSFEVWGIQVEAGSTVTGYLPTEASARSGLTTVTRGVNGTTAASASSGDSIQQLPYALSSVDMPVRLKGVSISSDGTGAGRLTLCDNNGNTLCDIDIPDGKIYTLFLPDEGIVFPNGVFVSNTINVTGYTVFTAKYSGPNLT